MKETKSIVWFRQDLRLKENPALEFAVSLGKVLPIYILDQENAGDWLQVRCPTCESSV